MPLPPTIVDGGFHIGGRSAQDSATEVDGGFVAPELPSPPPFTGEPKIVDGSYVPKRSFGVPLSLGGVTVTRGEKDVVEGGVDPIVAPCIRTCSECGKITMHKDCHHCADARKASTGNASPSDGPRVDPHASNATDATQPTPVTPVRREPPRGFRFGPRA